MLEVDHLWVGEKTQTGDAICARFTRPDTGELAVVIIDGGFHETGTRIAQHVRTYYGTSTVDLVVCTHPDDDHIAGLTEVVEELNVQHLLIHRPSRYGYGDDDGVKSAKVEALVDLAVARGVNIIDDLYAGTQFFGGALTIAGPSEHYYRETLADQQALAGSSAVQLAHKASPLFSSLEEKARSLFGDPGETMTGDNGGTSPRNNSSIILDLQVDDQRVLFTGDAGVPALTAAADELDALGLSGRTIDLFDVPHHGSRHNLTPDLLTRLLGAPTDWTRGCAVASVGKEAWDHPRPEVANAIRRRGYPVYCTRGISLWWHSDDAPARWQYNGVATQLDWLDESDDSAA